MLSVCSLIYSLSDGSRRPKTGSLPNSWLLLLSISRNRKALFQQAYPPYEIALVRVKLDRREAASGQQLTVESVGKGLGLCLKCSNTLPALWSLATAGSQSLAFPPAAGQPLKRQEIKDTKAPPIFCLVVGQISQVEAGLIFDEVRMAMAPPSWNQGLSSGSHALRPRHASCVAYANQLSPVCTIQLAASG